MGIRQPRSVLRIGGTFTTLGFIDAALLGLQTQEAVN
jgi:hypothetical protein